MVRTTTATDHGFGQWVSIHALRNPDRVAYVDGNGGAETTFTQLEERTNRLADGLRAKGVGPGDRVALLCLNSPQMMEIYLAVAKLTAGRLSREVADACIQFHGGMGYMEETWTARYFRDARLGSIGGGADEVMLQVLARLDGLPA